MDSIDTQQFGAIVEQACADVRHLDCFTAFAMTKKRNAKRKSL